jgi:phage-related protein
MPDVTAAIGSIKFKSIASVGEQYRQLNLDSSKVGLAVGAALKLSPTKGLSMAKGILKSCTDRDQAIEESKRLISWAGESGSEERQLVAKTLHANKGSVFLIHHISAMPRQRAQEFMADYFTAGGDVKSVAHWLQIAGAVLRKHRVKPSDTAGVVVEAAEWVAGKAEDAVDAVIEGVETVVNAVVDAGKALIDVVNEVVSWTVAQVADLVNALVEAGKSIADILVAALEAGFEGLKKFVKAIVEAGKAVADVLIWAVEQGAAVLGDVLRALRDAAVRVGKILQWAALQTLELARQVVQTLIDIGQSVGQVLAAAAEMAYSVVKASLKALIAIGRSIGEIVVTIFTHPWDIISVTVRALLEIGHTVGDLFQSVTGAVADGFRKMTRAIIEAGKSVASLIEWAADKSVALVNQVVRGILDAGKSLVDLMASVATRAISVVSKFVAAVFEMGRTFTQLIKDLVSLSVTALGKILQAAFNLGKTLVEFVAHTISRTYKAAARLIDAALRAGVAAAELLNEVVGKTYQVLRKMVNGILKAMGPIGDVLNWVLDQAGSIADTLWHKALSAIRYAKGKLSEALDWAAKKGEEALQAIVRAWESIGEDLRKVYEWAKNVAATAGDAIWEFIGSVTFKLENSIQYVLSYLEKDFIPGMQKFIKGVLDAGAEIADLVTWMASRAYTTVFELVNCLFAYGSTLADLMAESIKHPDQAFNNFLKAVQEGGKTLKDIYQVAIIDSAEQFLERVSLTLKNLGNSIKEMLNAVAEISFGAVDTVIIILLNTLASYRPLSRDEKEEAGLIYGNSIDLDKIYVSVEDLANDVIFGLQDWANGTSDSRAFTTNTLINFDVDDGITRHTLIHELCHVWQSLVTGPFYMAEAIHAQILGDGYNYGYDESLGDITLIVDYDGNTDTFNKGQETGEGAQQVLKDADGNFDAFNREQQAQIIMHYFVRRCLLNQDPSEYEPWQKYVDVVKAA